MRIALPVLAVRVVGVLAVTLLPVGCSDRVTAPPPATVAPPSLIAGPLAPDAPLRAALPATSPHVYPVTVTLFVNQTAVGMFPAVYGSSGNDKGIAFFPSWSPTLSVRGGGVISYTDGIPRGQGGIVALIGQGPPDLTPFILSIDFAQFNVFQGNPFVLAAGGIPGGGCIFATATGGDGVRFTVRLDFVPRRR